MKKQRAARRSASNPAFPAKLLFLFFLVAVSLSLAYVWGHGRSRCLGERIKALERELQQVDKVYANELLKWENMKSPPNVARVLARYNQTMVWPAESSIVRLSEPAGVEGAIADLRGSVAVTSRGHVSSRGNHD